MYKKGDFHLHSNASDGNYSPSELVKIASAEGIDIMALTDHDTTAGTDEAIAAGKALGIKVLPGIELSTLENGESIHILGFFRDNKYLSNDFQSFLKEMNDYRKWRAEKIVENLKKLFNISIDLDKLLRETEGVIARPHIAKAIIAGGYNYSWEYIFQNIISKDSPAYVPNKNISISEGIKILKDANAVVVLAHPILIKNSTIDELMKFDFDGIEAIYSMNSQEDTEKLKETAKKYNKIYTAGSDFHGIGRHDVSHGTAGCVSLTGEDLQIFLDKIGCL